MTSGNDEKKVTAEWQIDYDQAAQYWIQKDNESAKLPKEQCMERVEQFIKAHNTCALATGYDTFVRCTPIEYMYVDGIFYLLSEGGLKFKALKDNKNVCLAIYSEYKNFGELSGMQVMGVAEVIEPFSDEYLKVLEIKKINVEFIRKMPHPMNLIKVVPTEIDYLDSGLKKDGYGTRQHVELCKKCLL